MSPERNTMAPTNLHQEEPATTGPSDTFRDSVSSIDKKGKRIWIYPRKPAGAYHRARAVVAVLLIAFMAGVPFIKSDGHPLFLFDVVNRKFILFGFAFWPQDFHIFALGFLSLIVFVVLFTAVFGRLWCGWACPQTVFMEMVFRKVEFWIEGDGSRQRALNAMPVTLEKIFMKSLKHTIFFGLSFVVGNILLAWIIGVDSLVGIITDPPAQHLAGLSFMLLFSGLFYFIFARFRENACIYVCPYGRLQSVLLDRNSIVVAYDFRRGEPRGPLKKVAVNGVRGDCIDCSLCVQVCPTGIDIRNGTQLECVNCTACMDVCDGVMGKIQRPIGLIRYASHNLITAGESFRVTPRIIGYSAVLMLLMGLVAVLAATRSDVEATILRARGTLYRVTPEGRITNEYTANIVNKTFETLPIVIRTPGLDAEVQLTDGDSMIVEAGGLVEPTFVVSMPPSAVTGVHMKIRLGVFSRDRLIDEVETSFVAPAAAVHK